MKHHGSQDHPEVNDLENICHIVPQDKNTQRVCQEMAREKKRIRKIKEDDDLNEALEETFPASDSITKY